VADPVMRIEGLRKSFGALHATDNVTLDIVPGELHAIIGPNGAGKTTLINQISGIITPDSGHIWFAGTDVTRLPVHARAALGIARSFQITSILPGFSALENVALAVQARVGTSFRFLGRAAAERELNEPAHTALAETGLAARAHVLAAHLSHGERRALELAIALAMQPKLLLLDEPIVLVEHDMAAVFALADRISVLIYGRILASGPPEAVRADPQVVTAYLGEEME
jgi:branched-chain amino acid transport system ATP-binding protein